MYKIRRQAFYSQTFLRKPELVTKLVGISSIGKKDVVLEIGPGRGVITRELVKVARQVIAVEIDSSLADNLRRQIANPNLKLYKSDFLKFDLPNFHFKVFANIPFSITADVIRKLTTSANFTEGYLIIQKEAAEKFVGMPYAPKNSAMSVSLKLWFDIQVVWHFDRRDFMPRPRVDSVMLYLKRHATPLVSDTERKEFEDFVLYLFNRKKVAWTDFNQIIRQYERYSTQARGVFKRIVATEAAKIRHHQQTIQKIHRTRVNKRWRRFK